MTRLLTDREMAREAALDLLPGQLVNVGIGLPCLVPAEVAEGSDVLFHSENGIVGMGARALPGEEDYNLTDAAKTPVTLVPGGCYVDHSESFAIIRGGHLDVAILGAYEVSVRGDLANWRVQNSGVPAVGGAMDLAVGARSVRVMTRHRTRNGPSKLVTVCSYPLTSTGSVERIYTDIGTFRPAGETFELLGVVEGWDLDSVRAEIGAPVTMAAEPQTLPRTG